MSEFDAVSGAELPAYDGGPGDDCPECGRTIRSDPEIRMCHSCRVRPHEILVERLVRAIQHADSDPRIQSSIAFAVRREVWDAE